MAFNISAMKISLNDQGLGSKSQCLMVTGNVYLVSKYFFTRIFVPVKMRVILGVTTQEILLANYTAW